MTNNDSDDLRESDRLNLLHALDEHTAEEIPCRSVDIHTAGAWTSEEDDEQRVAAAACRSLPCPLIDQCRAYGLTWPRELGAYGGMTEKERRKAAREGTAA